MTSTVDLSAVINRNVVSGHPADFPVTLRPLRYEGRAGDSVAVSDRLAVVREDTGRALAVVSSRYSLVPHQELLDLTERAISGLDIGAVPRGIYVDRGGARMRAIFKFPGLAARLRGDDQICPCVRIVNTYDGTSRISFSIGAFRFVCTNLAVGGGGVFAGGFVAVHKGENPLAAVEARLERFLCRFEAIAELYRAWIEMRLSHALLSAALSEIAQMHRRNIRNRLGAGATSVFDAYNTATDYATHHCRSAQIAFSVLEGINRGFQREFPEKSAQPALPPAYDVEETAVLV